MQNKLIHYLGFTAFMLIFSGTSSSEGLPPLTHSLSPINNSVKAKDLRFRNLDDKIIDLKQLKGKVVVVNFWATWCPPCRREMASLERLHQATKERNVEILAVNIGEDIDTVFSFLGRVEPSPQFQILFDYEAESMKKWSIRGLPTTYIISKTGTLAYKAIGGREFDHPDILKKVLALSHN